MSQNYEENSREDERLVEDLQTQSAKQRNILISRIVYGVVGLCVLGVVAAIVTVLILTYTNPVNKRPFQFDDIFNGQLFPSSYSVQWSFGSVATSGKSNVNAEVFTFWNSTLLQNTSSPTNETYTYCNLVQYNAVSNQQTILVSYAQLQKNGINCNAPYTPSPNNRYVAFMLDTVKLYRHSILGRYVIYDTVSGTSQNASPNPGNLQKTFSWCNQNKVAPTNYPFSFVENNNIFVAALSNSVNVITNVTKVTTDGDNEILFNGVTDWLYEEEVYGGVSTMEWNTDCTKLAFLKLNNTLVPPYQYEDYSIDNSYPLPKSIRIPTPGYPNPIVSTHVYDTSSNNLLTLDIHVGLNTSHADPLLNDIYVYDLVWSTNNKLATVRVPRLQNQKDVLLSDTSQFNSTTKIVPSTIIKTDKTNSWIQYAAGTLLFLEPANLFVDITVDSNNPKHHYHLALYDYNQGTAPTFLTSGDFDVVEIANTFNPTTKEVFYASNQRGSTTRDILAVKYDGSKTSRYLSNSKVGYYTASFSPSGQYYQLSFLGPDMPVYSLQEVTPVSGVNGTVLLDNSPLQVYIDNIINMPNSVIKTIQNRDGVEMNALFVYPPTFNENSDIQYPTIMRVYGGPGNQLVLQSYAAMHDPLSLYWASLGFIVVTVDGRGTGGRGEDYMTCTYLQLGVLEAQDQIAAAKSLKGMYFVDGKRLGIWGWSYGGYMTLMSLASAENQQIFKLGMAVAPVTDWRYYDSAYTERYMQWPSANPIGYYNSSVITRVTRQDVKCPLLPNKINPNGDVEQSYSHLLLVHGTSDDNVHPLNSFNLMTVLQDRQVQFSIMFYPNKDHSITGGNTRRHLYRLLTSKMQEKLLV